MLKGDIGLRSIFAIVLGLMALSLLISVSSVGSLGGALQQGFDEVGTYTDRTAEIEDKETLSDLTLFVKHRAADQGCAKVARVNAGNWNNDPRGESVEGYPGLSEVEHLGQKPECFGGEAGIIRDPPISLDQENPDENYMTGIFSREQFEITNNDTIFNSATGNTWLDSNIAGFYDSSLNSLDESMEVKEDGIGTITGTFMVVGGILGAPGSAPGAAIGGAAGYAVGSLVEDAFNNLTPTETSEVIIIFQDNNVDLEDRVNAEDFESLPEDPSELEDGDIENLQKKVVFCEGDKGYVQSNRGTIANSDGASSQEPLYPVIVVEESKYSECENPDLDRADKIPENEPTSGRVLYITGRTDKDHPFVRGPALGGSDRNFAFDLHNLNEQDDELNKIVASSGRSISIENNPDRSTECVIGMWDHRSSAVDATGYITIERGTKIDYDGVFPPRSSSRIGVDNLEDRTDRSLPPRPSTKNLYDQYAQEGFTGENWKTPLGTLPLNNKILYDYGGEKSFELYGDLICAPHHNNEDFENDYSEWRMCSEDEEVDIEGNTWSCNPETGDWKTSGSNSCSGDLKKCPTGQCVADLSNCAGTGL